MNALIGLCLVIAAGFWSAATWLVYHGTSPASHEWAVIMLLVGTGMALAIGFVLLVAVSEHVTTVTRGPEDVDAD